MRTTDRFRRNFLLLLAGGTFTAITGTPPSMAKIQSRSTTMDPLSFIDISGLGPPQEAKIVEDSFCPLHREKIILNEAIPVTQRDAAETLLKQEFSKSDQQWQDSFAIVWTSQHYGVPDTSGICCQLLAYCRNAQEFLYSNVKGLFQIKPAWSLLSHEINYPQVDGHSFRALVGRFAYLVVRIKILNANNEIQDPYMISACPLERSLNFISADPKTYTPKNSTIYIIPGLTSLISPYSELLHISQNEPTLRYTRELAKNHDEIAAQELARQFCETITEAMSITLTRQALQNNQYVGRMEQLSTLTQHMNEYLPDLEAALAYCHDQGVQECFDTFQKNPGLLRKKILEYRVDM